MSKKSGRYAETLVVLVVATAVAHYLANLDWRWAIVTGAAASVLAGTLLHTMRTAIGERLLILGTNLATIAVIVKVATVSPVRASAIVVACVLVVLAPHRREIAGFIHRVTGH